MYMNSLCLFPLLLFSLVSLWTIVMSSSENEMDSCLNSQRGVLKFREKKEPNEYINVTAVLKNDSLHLFRGSEIFDTINIKEIIAPLIISSTNTECLTISSVSKDKIELCCLTEECINHWWFLLTKQIMCLNQGDMRKESGSINTLEKQQQKKLETEEEGIYIHIKENLDEIPSIKIRTE